MNITEKVNWTILYLCLVSFVLSMIFINSVISVFFILFLILLFCFWSAFNSGVYLREKYKSMNWKQQGFFQTGLTMIFIILLFSFFRFTGIGLNFFMSTIMLVGAFFYITYLDMTLFDRFTEKLNKLTAYMIARKWFFAWVRQYERRKKIEERNRKAKRTPRK